MFRMFSAPPPASLKSSALERGDGGFSLFEIVVAIGVISFALISIIGVMSISMSIHQDSSNDAVFSIMTETALQEVRNYNTPANSLYSGSAYTFSKLGNFTKAAPGYVYFDEDGQITADSSWNLSNTAGVPQVTTSTTAANQSTEVGVNLGGSTFTANQGHSGMPLTAALTTIPANTVYACQIAAIQPTLASGATTPSMYLIRLTFSWPQSAPVANQHTRVVVSSISNNFN